MSWDHANEALEELLAQTMREIWGKPAQVQAAIPMVVSWDGIDYPVSADAAELRPDGETWTVTYSTPDPTAGTYGMGVFG